MILKILSVPLIHAGRDFNNEPVKSSVTREGETETQKGNPQKPSDSGNGNAAGD